jgi:hypothetical protein
MGAVCSCDQTCGSPDGAVAANDLLAEEDEAHDQVCEMVVQSISSRGKSDNCKRLPRLLGTESISSSCTSESTAASSSGRQSVETNLSPLSEMCHARAEEEEIHMELDRVSRNVSTEIDRLEQSSCCTTHRHLSDPSLNSGRLSETNYEVSSYPVCEALNRYNSRHVMWAPSPTHSVHRSEMSVPAYAEVYGMHPASFDFNKRGQKIDSFGCAIGPDAMDSPSASVGGSEEEASPPHDGRFGRLLDSTRRAKPSAAKVVQAPRAPPGAIFYT